MKQWLTADVVETLFAPLEADGYLGRVTHLTYDFGPPEPIGSIVALRRRAASWRYAIVSLFAGDPIDPEVEIFLGLDPVGPRFAVGVAGADPRFRADVVRIAFAAELHDDASVASARAAHERWVTPLVPTSLDAGWNDPGDFVAGSVSPRVVVGLTFYGEGGRLLQVDPPAP